MKKYIIFPYADINEVDFDYVLETDISTLRVSNDGLLTIVKWIDETGSYVPDFVSKLSQVDGPYSEEEILDIMQTVKWK